MRPGSGSALVDICKADKGTLGASVDAGDEKKGAGETAEGSGVANAIDSEPVVVQMRGAGAGVPLALLAICFSSKAAESGTIISSDPSDCCDRVLKRRGSSGGSSN